MKFYIYLYYGKITLLKTFISSVNYLLFIAWDSEGALVYLFRESSLKNKKRSMRGGEGLSAKQLIKWNSPFSSKSIVANYYIIILSFILYFVSFLKYQGCFSHWLGISQLFAALTWCSRRGWWITSLCLLALHCLPILPNFCWAFFFSASSKPEEQLTFDLCFINIYNLWASPYILNIFGGQAKGKRMSI